MDSLLHILQRIPVKLLLAVTLVSLFVGQCQPFSRFPMYSSFPPQADLYYLADGSGQPLPSLRVLGIFVPEIKQRVEHQLEDLQDARPAADQDQLRREAGTMVLHHLAQERASMLQQENVEFISLRRVILRRRDGQLVQQESEVAAWP